MQKTPERRLQLLELGDQFFDDDQPEVPDDDPRWAQHDAYMDQHRATLAAKRETCKLSTAMQKAD